MQTCGDAHISNFGGFAAPDRRMVFGPNDFDETLPGSWNGMSSAWLPAVEIAARDVGIPAKRRRQLGAESVRAYREGMRGFAEESHLDVWYDRLAASELVDRFGGHLGRGGRVVFSDTFAKARRRNSLRAAKKLTEKVEGQLRFRHVPPLLVPLSSHPVPAQHRDENDYVRELLDE